jgi:hypothetical protein
MELADLAFTSVRINPNHPPTPGIQTKYRPIPAKKRNHPLIQVVKEGKEPFFTPLSFHIYSEVIHNPLFAQKSHEIFITLILA